MPWPLGEQRSALINLALNPSWWGPALDGFCSSPEPLLTWAPGTIASLLQLGNLSRIGPQVSPQTMMKRRLLTVSWAATILTLHAFWGYNKSADLILSNIHSGLLYIQSPSYHFKPRTRSSSLWHPMSHERS